MTENTECQAVLAALDDNDRFVKLEDTTVHRLDQLKRLTKEFMREQEWLHVQFDVARLLVDGGIPVTIAHDDAGVDEV